MMLRIFVSLCGGNANRSSLEFWSESPIWLRKLSSDVCNRWISRSHCSTERGVRRLFPSVWIRPYERGNKTKLINSFEDRIKSLDCDLWTLKERTKISHDIPSVSVELSDNVRADSKLSRRWYRWWWWSRVGLMNAWFSTWSSRLYWNDKIRNERKIFEWQTQQSPNNTHLHQGICAWQSIVSCQTSRTIQRSHRKITIIVNTIPIRWIVAAVADNTAARMRIVVIA